MRRARTRHKRQRGNDRRLIVLGSPLQRARRAQSRARAGARAPAVALHGSRTRVPRGVTVPTAPNDTSSERQSHDRPTIEDGRKLRPNTQEKHASASASASARDTRAGKPCTARRTAKQAKNGGKENIFLHSRFASPANEVGGGRGEGPRDHDGALRIVLPAESQSSSSRAVAALKPDLGPTAAAEPPASEPPALAAGSRQPAAPPPLLIAFARWSVHSLRVVMLHRHLVRMSVVVLRLPCRPPCQHPTTAPMNFPTELAFQL